MPIHFTVERLEALIFVFNFMFTRFWHRSLQSVIFINSFASEASDIVSCSSYEADEDDERTLDLNSSHSSSRHDPVGNQELRNEISDYSVIAANDVAVQITQVCETIV
jgi:hypothetical protein